MTFKEWIGLKKTPSYEDARWFGPVLFGVVALAGAALLILVVFRSFEALLTGAGDLRSYLYFLVALIGLPFVVWRSVVAHRQATTAEQGLLTDRFTKAVEQLGAERTVKFIVNGKEVEVTKPNLEVRLGGIYALERLAKDSLDDHITVMEVLCAYLRENATKPDPEDEFMNGMGKPSFPRADIQSALTVIARRDKARAAHEQDTTTGRQPYVLDLSGCGLALAHLDHAEMANANLRGADLRLASLRGANLYNANLREANLNSTLLYCADLSYAQVYATELATNYLKFAAVRSVDLRSVKRITEGTLELLFGDQTTRLPEGVEWPENWGHFENESAFYAAWHTALEEAGLR